MSVVRLTATSGTFEKFPFWQVLCDAQTLKFSGTLALIHPQKKKSLMFERGKLIGSRSSLGEESTIQLLIDTKKVSLADIRVLMPVLENRETMLQLDVLVKNGKIQPTQIQDVLDYQTLVRVSEVFKWNEARFAFVDQIPPEIVRVPHSKETFDLVMSILLKQAKTSGLDMALLNVEGTEYSYLLDVLTCVPLKLKNSLKKIVTQNSTSASLAELQSLNAAEVLPYISVLNDLKIIKIKKSFLSSQADSKTGTHTLPLKELNERIKVMSGLDYYGVLKIKRNAKHDDIKNSFLALARQYHPDQLPENISLEVKKMVSSLFSMASQAHATLIDPKKRQEYDAQLELKESGFDANQAEKIMEAEMGFIRAETLAKKGDFSTAIKELEAVLKVNDTEADYHLLQGWCLFKEGSASKNSPQIRKGKEQLARALAMKPTLFQGHYYLGLIAKAEGDMILAKEMFEKTLKINPKHPESNSELRVMNMREQKSSGLKGFLQKKKS